MSQKPRPASRIVDAVEQDRRTREIEMKLSLPHLGAATLLKRLKGIPLLARHKPVTQHLHNVYYDTPDQFLRRERMALRLRQAGTPPSQHWLQTLKTGHRNDSALSQRGEWETPVPGNALTQEALQATPWEDIDPQGVVFRALAPCFTTQFVRTLWTIRRRNGDTVEIALDIGNILAAGQSTAICELELELLSGEPEALFQIARQIANSIAVLPLSKSKAQRGYELSDGSLNLPMQAQPLTLSPDLKVSEVVVRLLREMFCQFTTNLNVLSVSDHPEAVHQARIGWRRFRSALRLFKALPALDAPPSWEPMRALLVQLGQLRDLDVACKETLPQLAAAYVAGNAQRQALWHSTMDALEHAAGHQREAVRQSLAVPAVGLTLLEITHWLENLPTMIMQADAGEDVQALRPWAKALVGKAYDQFRQVRRKAGHHPVSATDLHKLRIRAKRLRYGVAALQSLLPERLGRRLHQEAVSAQEKLGASRDLMQLITLVTALDVDERVVDFLRGYVTGRGKQQPACYFHKATAW